MDGVFFFSFSYGDFRARGGEGGGGYNGYKSNRSEIDRVEGDDTGLDKGRVGTRVGICGK